MNNEVLVKVEGVSKKFCCNFNRWFRMNMMHQEDPYAKIGHVSDRTQKAEKCEPADILHDFNIDAKQENYLSNSSQLH